MTFNYRPRESSHHVKSARGPRTQDDKAYSYPQQQISIPSAQQVPAGQDAIAFVKQTVFMQRTNPDFAEFAIGHVAHPSFQFLYQQGNTSFERLLYVQELQTAEKNARRGILPPSAAEARPGDTSSRRSLQELLQRPVLVPQSCSVGPHAPHALSSEDHGKLLEMLSQCDTAERLDAAVCFLFQRLTKTECALETAAMMLESGTLTPSQSANVFYMVASLLYEHQVKGLQPMPYRLVFCRICPRLLRALTSISRSSQDLSELSAVVATWRQSSTFPGPILAEMEHSIAVAPKH